MCLLNGHGIEPNFEDAVYWLNKSINLGEAKAIFTLASMHEQGIG